MQITFDPHNEQDIELLKKIIGDDVAYSGEQKPIDGNHVSMNDAPQRVDQAEQYDAEGQEAIQGQVNSAQVFAGNGVQSATSSPQQAQTGAASADPVQSGGQPADGQPELDSAGIPWDERIHAETKAQNKNGTWRNKRGVDKDYVKQVTDELRAQYSEVSQATVPPQGNVAPPPNDQAQGVSAPPQGNVAPPPAEQAQGSTASTFPEFMKAVVAYIQANNLTMVDVNNILSSTMGVQSAAMLSSDPSRIPEAMANLGIQ